MTNQIALRIALLTSFVCAMAVAAGAQSAFSASAVAAHDGARAAPRILMFHGGPFEEPAFMTDWKGILAFLTASTAGVPASAESLEDRPYATVTAFWNGPRWEAYATDPERLRTLRPEQAAVGCPFTTPSDCVSAGRFYPATGDGPAVLDLARHAGAHELHQTEQLERLRAAGVPLRVEPAPR